MSGTRGKRGDGCGKYHHGDLRNALVIAAAELIEESGSEDFSMVDAARRAGVSSAAPYRHFRDRDDLLTAVAELGFYALSEELLAVAATCEPGTLEAINTLGTAYIRFVTERPAFFNLMWGERGLQPLDREDSELRANGFQMLVHQVELWCEREGIEADPEDISLKLWSMSIGLCHLSINHHLERFVTDVDPGRLLTTSARSFLQGIKETGS